MCTATKQMWNRAESKGREEGREEGDTIGAKNFYRFTASVVSEIQNNHVTFDEAADKFDVPEKYRSDICSLCEKFCSL